MDSKRSVAAIAGAIVLLGASSARRTDGPEGTKVNLSILVQRASRRLAHAVPDDACALLTQAQVSAALGVPVAPGQRLVPKSPLFCGWSEPGRPTVTGKKLVLTLMTARQFDLGKAPFQGLTKTPVSGIGDDAYYVTASGLGTALSVKKGALFVQVKVGGAGFSVDTIKTMEKTLALEVLAKA